MDWFSFAWNGNVQEIWKLPGPEPSFTAKYHFDYWIKNVLSLVVLFRNLTTHLHLMFYIVMMYPVLTGERPGLMLPWLYLQMAKNIVTDVISTFAGVLLCWILHSCKILTLEFLVVRIISTMPSIYLWRRLRTYYFDLYYAEMDREFSFPVTKAIQGSTLAQRRRAAKSLDGTTPVIPFSDNRPRVNSCLTYEEFFGPANREVDSENKISKSLTTLLTVESMESDDVAEDSCLKIIDDENLTPAEKTLKILGLVRGEVDAVDPQLCEKTSTTDLAEGETRSLETAVDAEKNSSITGETVAPCSVGIQVRLADESEANQKKCECCEATKCSKEEEEAEEISQSTKTKRNTEGSFGRGKPIDCCNQNREDEGKINSEMVPTASRYFRNNSNPGSCLRAVGERDGIAWENLKEINFVSVIKKALCTERSPFKLQRESENRERSLKAIFEDRGEEFKRELLGQDIKEIVPEREDGTKFMHRSRESVNLDPTVFSGQTSASFGAESDILALNSSFVFEKLPTSGTQSFDSARTPAKQLIRPDHDTGFDSYFKSSFQRHSDMFDDTRGQLEPVSPLQYGVHSCDYRVVHRANEDSRLCQTELNSFEERTGEDSCSPGFYRSRNDTPRYRRGSYDGWDSDQGNSTGNGVDVVRDTPENSESKNFENQNHPLSLEMNEKDVSSRQMSPEIENDELIHVSPTGSRMFGPVFEAETISNCRIAQTEEQGSTTTFIVENGGKLSGAKSREKSSKDRRPLASVSRLSRPSKTGETHGERETKEMQALKAYNEKTLFKYKREMDACKAHERTQDENGDPLLKNSPAGTNGNSSDQAFYVPSVPELERPEKKLILSLEKAYARFTRSKPVDPVNSVALHGNNAAKKFFDIYTGSGRLKKDSRNIKADEKTGMRKQHSKYSKPSEVINESDVTSRSCKRIEGPQKGRELDRTLAQVNIREKNMEIYFLDRQIDDKPTTSKNTPLKTIKSFSRKDGADLFPAVSSEILTPEATRSSIVEVSNNPEKTIRRIDDTDYYSVREAVKNVDWSFQRPTPIVSDGQNEKGAGNTCPGIMIADASLQGENISHRTTENILQRVFSNGENSERGFRLGESANKVYPIFNTAVTFAIDEIVRAAALRGYSDEFISQPATEIEIPEIEGGSSYGLTNLSSELSRRSSSGFLRCSIFPEDIRAAKERPKNGEPLSVTTSAGSDLQDKKLEAVRRETNPLDQDESKPIQDEKASTLLSKQIVFVEPRLTEMNVIGPEDVPEDGNLPNWPKSRRISAEQVRSALRNVVLKSLSQKIPVTDEPPFEFDVATHRDILDHLNAGGKELRSIVFEFFDQFPSCLSHRCLPRDLRGSEFVAGFQMLTNLFAIECKSGEIINATGYRGATEEAPASRSADSTLERNGEPDRAATQPGTSAAIDIENVTANSSMGRSDLWRKKGRGMKENNVGHEGVAEINSNVDSRTSSLERIDERKKLLSNTSELLNGKNLGREAISSAFVQIVKQSTSSSDATKGTEAEILAPNKGDNEFFTPGYREPNGFKSRDLMDAEREAEAPESWVTDDEEQAKSRSPVVCPVKEIFLIDAGNATPDIVLRDIETAERAIISMKNIFEQFFAGGQIGREKTGEPEAPLEMKSKVSSLTNLRFPVDAELRKLQNLVQTVVNYVTITECSSAQSIKSSNEAVESDTRRKELNAACRSVSSDNLEEAPEMIPKNEARSNTDDRTAAEASVPKSRKPLKNSESPVGFRDEKDRFSGWDRVIPLSTKRQIAKRKRKSKPKKSVAVEPARRVVKVVKLIDERNSDFFSARSVPQRGRGLSSGYLMDSDSDGNFTVSRPLTPVSVESDISQNFSRDSVKPDVFLNPLKASEIFPKSDTSHSRTTNRSIEICWSSLSANLIKEKTVDDIKTLQTEESLEISGFLLPIYAEASSTGETTLPGISSGYQSTQHALCDEELHVLRADSLSTDSDLRNMTSVDAAGMENKLKEVVQRILNHQFSGLDPVTNGLRIGSRIASVTSVPGATRIQSATDLQSNNPSLHKKIQESLFKADDTSIEQLNAHCSRDSDLISFEMSPRKSGVSMRHVAIGTEYNVEVFRELLDIFEKMHSMEKKKSHGVVDLENGNDVNREDERELVGSDPCLKNQVSSSPEPATTGYDSFDSLFSQDTTEVSEPPHQAISLSNQSYFEDFPEQVNSSLQFSVASTTSSEAMELKPNETTEEKSLREEISLANSDKNSNDDAAAAPGSSKSKKDTNPKQKGIPRLVRGSKERK